MYKRRKSKEIKIGSVKIGGNNPIAVQSMTFTKTSDKDKTLEQILSLEKAGCDIVRFSVPDEESAKNISYFKENTNIPLVADIHFNYRLAIAAAQNGIDKIRINPGNIGSDERIKAVADECRKRHIPIRIGVNGGSLEKHILEKYGSPCPEALFESAMYHVHLLEKFDFYDIVVSIKSSSVADTVNANRIFASETEYPLHLGVTEAGTGQIGIIKSSAGIGAMLIDGIGDTIRVSLTDESEKEVLAAKDILKSLGLKGGIDIISCPTCARTNIDVIGISRKLNDLLKNSNKNIKVAVMGCAVNGPGEAKDADIGVAGGNGDALLFKKGKITGKIPESKIVDILMSEIEKM